MARLRTLVVGAAVALACGCAVPGMAEGFAVEPGSFTVSTSIEEQPGVRVVDDQAGAHADLTTSFAFAQSESGAVGAIPRNAEVVLPVGFAGYPAALKTCSPVQLQVGECPADAQVGTIEVTLRLRIHRNC